MEKPACIGYPLKAGLRGHLWADVLDSLASEYRTLRDERVDVPIAMMQLLLLTHEDLVHEVFRDAMKARVTTYPGAPRHRAFLSQREYDDLADSLLRAARTSDELLLGYLYELYEGGEDDRARYAMFLGEMKDLASRVTPHLIQTLTDKNERVAQEAITALGMIGPAAKDAIPTLEKLTEHEDPQIAARAKAALRQVRGGRRRRRSASAKTWQLLLNAG